MKHLKFFSKIVLAGLLGFLLVNCQKDEAQNETQLLTAKSQTESMQLKAAVVVPPYMQNLIATVNDMVGSGILTKEEGQSLLAKINSAANSINKGNIKALNGQLGALINELNYLVEMGTISQEQGLPLLHTTEYIVNKINHVPVISDGLMAWYPFDGNTNDLSGNDRNGVSLNVTYTTDINNAPNSAVNFDGDGAIVIPLSWPAKSSFTISFWYKTTLGGTFLTASSIFIGADPASSRFYTSWASVRADGTRIFYSPGGNPFFYDNTWHHVVLTHNSIEGRVVTYFDGTLHHATPVEFDCGSFIGNYPPELIIGMQAQYAPIRPYFIPIHYAGTFDEIYFFNRAITLSEVEQLYRYLK